MMSVLLHSGVFLIGAGGLWWLSHRLTQDRWLCRVVTLAFAVRAALAVVLFAIAWFGWPIMKSMQLGDGFWAFGRDGRAYHAFARQIATAWATGTELPRMETAIEYFAVVAAIYRFLGAHPLLPILLNGWLSASTALLAYLITRRLFDQRSARASALLVSCWPSSLLWSALLLKDAISWWLLLATLGLVIDLIWKRETPRRSVLLRRAAHLGLLACLMIAQTRLRFYVGSAVLLAAGLVFLPAAGWALIRRQISRAMIYLSVVAVIGGSVLFARTLNVYQLLSPSHPDRGHFLLGLAYRAQGQLNRAQDEFWKALSLSPTYQDAYLGAGAGGRGEQAIAAYTSYLQLAPADRRPNVLKLRARLHVEEGTELFKVAGYSALPRTVEAYRQAIEDDPHLIAGWMNLAVTVTEQDPVKFREALEIISRVETLAASETERAQVLKAQSHILARGGDAELAEGRIYEAVRLYEQAITLDPSSNLAYAKLALALIDRLGAVVPALALAQQAVEQPVTPTHAPLKAQVARLYLAIALAEEDPSKFQEALEMLQRAEALAVTAGDHAQINQAKSYLHMRQGDHQLAADHGSEAIRLYEDAVMLDPSSGLARAKLGWVMIDRQNAVEPAVALAQQALERAQLNARSEINALVARIYYSKARLDVQAGRIQEAIDTCVKRRLYDPSELPPRIAVGTLLFENGQRQAAIEMIEAELSGFSEAEQQQVGPSVGKLYRIFTEDQRRTGRAQQAAALARRAQQLDATSEGTHQTVTTATRHPVSQPSREQEERAVHHLFITERAVALQIALDILPRQPGVARDAVVRGRLDSMTDSLALVDDQLRLAAQETTPEALDYRREAFITTGGHSLMDAWVRVSSPDRLVTYLPRAMAIGLLAPFPSQWFDVQGSTGGMRVLSGIETALFYLLIPSLLFGFVQLLRQRRAAGMFLIVFVAAVWVPLSLVVANLGTLFRLRLLFMLPLLILIGAGHLEFCRWVSRVFTFRRRPAAKPGSPAPVAEPVVVLLEAAPPAQEPG